MKFSQADFPLLKWSLLTLVGSVAISMVALLGSGKYADKSASDLRNARSQFTDARNRLAAAQQDQSNMTTFADEYLSLKELNTIGDDHRLDWIEGMEKVRQQNPVVNFSYNIAPQKNYAPKTPVDSGNFDIHYSEMKLQFELLHEGQLLDFFAALRNQIKGWYQLEGCTLHRAANNENIAAQLKAECGGGWITLKNRNEPK